MRDREPFAEWFQAQLNRRGWTVPDFARWSGVSDKAVYAWVKQQRVPDGRSIAIIADTFRIDRELVMIAAGHWPDDGKRGDLERLARMRAVEPVLRELLDELEVVREGGREVPVYGTIPADTVRLVDPVEGSPVRILEEDLHGAQSPFALVASGDCLKDIGIHHGDTVILDRPNGRVPQDRQIVAVRVNQDEYTLKRWCVGTAGLIELRDGADRTVYTLSPLDEVEIVGFYVTFKPTGPR